MQLVPAEWENTAGSDYGIGETYQVDVNLSGISKSSNSKDGIRKDKGEKKKINYQMERHESWLSDE